MGLKPLEPLVPVQTSARSVYLLPNRHSPNFSEYLSHCAYQLQNVFNYQVLFPLLPATASNVQLLLLLTFRNRMLILPYISAGTSHALEINTYLTCCSLFFRQALLDDPKFESWQQKNFSHL
jgi:hypothetical protein